MKGWRSGHVLLYVALKMWRRRELGYLPMVRTGLDFTRLEQTWAKKVLKGSLTGHTQLHWHQITDIILNLETNIQYMNTFHHGFAHVCHRCGTSSPSTFSVLKFHLCVLLDVRLEPPVGGFEPLMTSSPSPPTCARQRTASFGSSSSISTTYQDITSTLLGRALAEVTTYLGLEHLFAFVFQNIQPLNTTRSIYCT